jgi:MFS family permease
MAPPDLESSFDGDTRNVLHDSALSDSDPAAEKNGGITPLPMTQMMIAFCIQMTEALNITVLFPYIAFMVEDFGDPYNTPENLGRYVGLLAACFCGAQFFSSWLWANAADRYGRKPALFVGTLGVAGGMFVFGTAKTFNQALAGRIISGILCGNLGILKTFLTEITDSSNRGGGFSVLSISWSIGTVFSPLIGGMLSKPCELYPDTFVSGTWLGDTFSEYPYLLPSLVCITVNIVTSILILIFLIETRPPSQVAYDVVSLDSSHGNEIGNNNIPTDLDDDDLYDEVVQMTSMSTVGDSKNNSGTRVFEQNSSYKKKKEEEYSNSVPLIWRRNVQVAVGSYGLLALGQIVLDETLPLYLKLDKERGGFSYGAHEIGAVLSLAGAIFTCFTLTLLPILANYNKSSLYFWGCLTTIPAALCMPVLPQLGHDSAWPLLLAALTWKNISLTLCFTAVCVQVSQSVSHDSELASVNAIGQSMAALSRAVGPACGGLLWSGFLTAGHVEGNFILVSAIMMCCVYLNRKLPPEIGV